MFLPRIETLHHARDNICLRGRLGMRLCRNHSGIHLGGTFTDCHRPRLCYVNSSRALSNNTTGQLRRTQNVQTNSHTAEPCLATPYTAEQTEQEGVARNTGKGEQYTHTTQVTGTSWPGRLCLSLCSTITVVNDNYNTIMHAHNNIMSFHTT